MRSSKWTRRCSLKMSMFCKTSSIMSWWWAHSGCRRRSASILSRVVPIYRTICRYLTKFANLCDSQSKARLTTMCESNSIRRSKSWTIAVCSKSIAWLSRRGLATSCKKIHSRVTLWSSKREICFLSSTRVVLTSSRRTRANNNSKANRSWPIPTRLLFALVSLGKIESAIRHLQRHHWRRASSQRKMSSSCSD